MAASAPLQASDEQRLSPAETRTGIRLTRLFQLLEDATLILRKGLWGYDPNDGVLIAGRLAPRLHPLALEAKLSPTRGAGRDREQR